MPHAAGFRRAPAHNTDLEEAIWSRSEGGWIDSIPQLLHRNVQRFRGGLVFKAHRLCVSLNSRLESESNKEEKSTSAPLAMDQPAAPPRASVSLATYGYT